MNRSIRPSEGVSVIDPFAPVSWPSGDGFALTVFDAPDGQSPEWGWLGDKTFRGTS
jgi:hypothetical protein